MTTEVSAEDTYALRAVLDRLGMSQRKLARLLGVKPKQVSRYVNGTYAPSWASACAIAGVLGVSLGTFRPGDPAHYAFFGDKGER